MNFHRWKCSEVSGKIVWFEAAGFVHCFTLQKLGGHGGDGDGGLASEGLEGSAVDDLFAILFLKLEPHPEHIATVRRSDGADGIGISHLADILGIGKGLLGAVFEIAHGENLREDTEFTRAGSLFPKVFKSELADCKSTCNRVKRRGVSDLGALGAITSSFQLFEISGDI